MTLASDKDQPLKTCFVVMPVSTPTIYAEQSGDPDHFAHVLDHLFAPALKDLGYEILLPAVAGSELIHAEIIKNLEQSDLVLCDLSSLNPNVFFELGIRTALDRPIVLVRDTLTPQIPFDLAAINVYTYDGTLKPWTLKNEIPRLTAHIKASIKSASDAGNAMWRYFGLTKRASPAEVGNNPLEAKMDLVIAELTNLRRRASIIQLQEDAAGAGSQELKRSDFDADVVSHFVRRMRRALANSDIDAEIVIGDGNILEVRTAEPIPDNIKETMSRSAALSNLSFVFRVSENGPA